MVSNFTKIFTFRISYQDESAFETDLFLRNNDLDPGTFPRCTIFRYRDTSKSHTFTDHEQPHPGSRTLLELKDLMLLLKRNSNTAIQIDEMEGIIFHVGEKPDFGQKGTPVTAGIFQKIVKYTGQEGICIKFKITKFDTNINFMSR